jgi:vanillate O-demethylase ferredoxin subunit
MLRSLRGKGKRARLVHLCRAPSEFSFRDTLEELGASHDVHVHFDSVAGGLYDVVRELKRTPRDAEVYCCGPAPLMRAVREFGEAEGLIQSYHFEFFSADPDVAERTGSVFKVVLNSTGREVPVEEGETILAALRNAGISVESECEEGVCGTCAVRVVAGTPDHRDQFLTDAERQENGIILVCVSRAKSKRLVLDI